MSATTVMIDDTATMLPSSVSSERSLFAQIELSASRTDSKIWDHAVDRITPRRLRASKPERGYLCGCADCPGGVFDLHEIAVVQIAHRVERAGDDAVAFLEAVR